MKTIAVALSGGIDSALSAFLLKEEGYRIIGLHADFGFSPKSSLPWLEKIASVLKIPLAVLPLKEAFQKRIVSYFVSEYVLGRTPNPCVVCNPQIKFGLLFQKAKALGADGLATGHYARIVNAPWGEGLTIARGLDREKDQSYFLHRLRGEKLKEFLFPLGNWTKNKVKETARQMGLPPSLNGESQDICFLPQGGYREFLAKQAASAMIHPGEIQDIHGNKLGAHQGLFAYTVGQRRGLGLPAKAPYYVIRMEPAQNLLIVGEKKDLKSTGCWLSGFHWICQPPDLSNLSVLVQIRYRHKPARASVIKAEGAKLGIRFQTPQQAVTPGQAAVLYQEDQILGGGWIESSWKK